MTKHRDDFDDFVSDTLEESRRPKEKPQAPPPGSSGAPTPHRPAAEAAQNRSKLPRLLPPVGSPVGRFIKWWAIGDVIVSAATLLFMNELNPVVRLLIFFVLLLPAALLFAIGETLERLATIEHWTQSQAELKYWELSR